MHSFFQHSTSKLKKEFLFPAIFLLLIQLLSGMLVIPQSAFFIIYLQERLSLAPLIISSLVAGAQFTGMLTALIGGAIITRLGSKWALACGLALACLNSLVFQTDSLRGIVTLWLIGGAGLALVTVGSASYLTRLNAQGVLGILAALYALSMTIGGAIGNPLAGGLIEHHGFGIFGWSVLALYTLSILVAALFLPHQQDQASEGSSLLTVWSSVISGLRQRNVRLVAVMRCLPTLFYGMLVVLIPLLINELSGNKVLVAAYGTTNLIVASAAQLLVGRLADRRGARLPSLIAYSGIILSGLGLAISSGTIWGLFAFGVLGIAAAWSLSTMMYIWVSDGIPKAEHPSTFGLLHAIWSLSMMGGSVFGGWFVTTLRGLPFLLVGLLNIGSIFLTTMYYGRREDSLLE